MNDDLIKALESAAEQIDLRAMAKVYGVYLSESDTEDSIREKIMTIIAPELTDQEKKDRVVKMSIFLHAPGKDDLQ